MKEIFKKLIRFIWNLIFGRKTVKYDKPQLEVRHVAPKISKTFGHGRHFKNNRKSNRARYVQYIDLGNGKTKAIYHLKF